MWRLLRWLVNAVCLLSLLACLGTAWLWRSLGRRNTEFDVSVCRCLVFVQPVNDGLAVLAVGGWPGPAGCRFGLDSLDTYTFRFERVTFQTTRGPALESGRLRAVTRPGGTPITYNQPRANSTWPRLSPPMPHWRAESLPYEGVMVATALAPLLWLTSRARRLLSWRRRRKRARLGRCPGCGYDLTGNASGTCSECGEAVPADRRVRP